MPESAAIRAALRQEIGLWIYQGGRDNDHKTIKLLVINRDQTVIAALRAGVMCHHAYGERFTAASASASAAAAAAAAAAATRAGRARRAGGLGRPRGLGEAWADCARSARFAAGQRGGPARRASAAGLRGQATA